MRDNNMIKIAICDDNDNDIAAIQQHLTEYLIVLKTDYNICTLLEIKKSEYSNYIHDKL